MKPGQAANASAIARVPASKGGDLEDAEWAVPEERLGAADCGGEGGAGRGADVEGQEALGNGVGGDGFDTPRMLERVGNDEIGRQQELDAAFGGASEEVRSEFEPLALDQRRLEVVAVGGEEGVGHATAHHQDVEAGQEILEGVDLPLDLGATENRREGALGCGQQAGERFDLAHHQAPGGPPRQVLEHAGGRGVGAVRAAESVVDVGAGRRGQSAREIAVVALLAGVKPEVLEQCDPARRELLRGASRGLADAVLGEEHGPREQLAESLCGRLQGVLEIALPLRSSAMRAEQQLRARRG